MSIQHALSILLQTEIVLVQTLKSFDIVVLKVENAAGQAWVVKLYPFHKSESIHKIVEIGTYLQRVKQRFPDLHLQTNTNGGGILFDYGLAQSTESDLRWAMVYPWVDHVPEQPITVELCTQMGRVMAKLHQVSRDFDQKLPLTQIDHHLISAIGPLAQEHALFQGLSEDTQTNFQSNLLQLCASMQAIGYAAEDYGLIHSDLHWGNWLQTEQGLVAIDFDETAYGHYLLDLAVVCNEMRTILPSDAQHAGERALWAGYKAQCGHIPNHWSAYWPAFKKIGAALYLNWAFVPDNAAVLEVEKVRNMAVWCVEMVAFNALPQFFEHIE
jgi:Ser/Thr protein kinase RdoA (MazF antagonist)